ncbi:phage tail protein [Pandoraea sp. CB10b_02]|uniref:phage tail protein n=1 Tax=Pandoraea sp. CB10b_02 TaxID=2014535 RepID=UPI00257B6702|nr:phage tail protein [Pandoraea sp. CB10b_02]
MDRKMIYPGQIPLETDLLDTNRFALIGLGKLAAAVLGTSTLVNGLACTPTAPASMQVQVAPGEIYSLQNLDGTAYSSLAADTTHQILKQGLMMDAATLSCPAPATSGQSINYLVQATYQDTDTNAVVLPYYNASNPTQAYAGPNNSGTAQNTVRKGVCTVNVKAGIAATTGTQSTPAPDSGYVGLYVVTVANGQSTITAGNISTVSGAPILSETLLQKISIATGDERYVKLSGFAALQPGEVQFFAMSAAPAGYMKANGAAVSRTTYAALFAAIGTTFGAGDGSTTFNLPDLRGEFLRGFDDGRGIDSGRSFGSAQAGTRFPSLYVYASSSSSGRLVSHPINSNGAYPNDNIAQNMDSQVTGTSGVYMQTSLTPSGSSGLIAFTSRPRNVALLACIKY